MWEDNSYCWVVMCKNNWFHDRVNLFFKHKIPLGETGVYASLPALKGTFTVKCDECHEEYLYKPSDVLKHDLELPVSFTPHSRKDDCTEEGKRHWQRRTIWTEDKPLIAAVRANAPTHFVRLLHWLASKRKAAHQECALKLLGAWLWPSCPRPRLCLSEPAALFLATPFLRRSLQLRRDRLPAFRRKHGWPER